ncbi:MAG: Gfo/Idh/MocA family oxidoreductase [Verrucomicrobia bacterium]|nr:Gfo/Idh/MocA family oxidoreductase [Verrucomicrobiota bacterium]MBV8278229.1 Gfo/Idh/MocA family oxidoreductase [Verrucomicrobiota bacterium]
MPKKIPRAMAIVGAGSIGYRHLLNLEHLGVEQLFVCDPNRELLARRKREHPNWKFYADLGDVAREQPEAVVVASPSALHEEQTRQALVWGCSVFVEKPLSTTLEGMERLAQEAIERDIVTMVACNMRFHPGPAMVRQLLDERMIGDLIFYRIHTGSYLPAWRADQDYRLSYSASAETGGAILDCIHELDLGLWYAGPAQLSAAKHVPGRAIGLETDGLAEILLHHHAGTLGSVHLNFIERDYRRSCLCVGTEGTLEWLFDKPEVVQYGPSPKEIVRHALPIDWQINDMYVDQMRHFLDCVAEGRPTQNSIADSLPCLRLALQARASNL